VGNWSDKYASGFHVIFLFNFRVLLTSALRALVKDSKLEIIGKFYVKKVTFSSSNVLNASIPIQNFFFRLLKL